MTPICRAKLWIWVISDMEVLCGCSCIFSGDSKLSWCDPVMVLSIRSSLNTIIFSFWIFFCVGNFFVNSHLSVCSLHSRQCKSNHQFYSRDCTFKMICIDKRALKMFIQSSSKTLIAEMQTWVKRRPCLTVQGNQVNAR